MFAQGAIRIHNDVLLITSSAKLSSQALEKLTVNSSHLILGSVLLSID